jgi:hypothetical protein
MTRHAEYNFECIPLVRFGGPVAEQTLKRAGIEALILNHTSPPFLEIVRRYPAYNPLASFVHIYLDDDDKYDHGICNTTQCGPRRFELLLEKLLEEEITGSGEGPRGCSNYNCIMPIIGEVLPERVRMAASRILADGIKKLLMNG